MTDLLNSLAEDLKHIDHDEKYLVSSAFLQAPHLNCSEDKKTRSAKTLALQLFPENESDPIKRQHSYIRYGQLLRDLKRRFEDQHPEREEEESHGCMYFCLFRFLVHYFLVLK